MKRTTLEDVFMEQIRELYDVEKQLVRALGKMAKAADSEELGEGLRQHQKETEEHVQRLDKVFEACDQKAKAKQCHAIRGLIEDSTLEMKERGPLQDLFIIEAGQKAEHYEMAAYGNARTLAERLGKKDVVDLLQQTLDEEKEADQKLTEVTPSILDSEEQSREAEEEEEFSNA